MIWYTNSIYVLQAAANEPSMKRLFSSLETDFYIYVACGYTVNIYITHILLNKRERNLRNHISFRLLIKNIPLVVYCEDIESLKKKDMIRIYLIFGVQKSVSTAKLTKTMQSETYRGTQLVLKDKLILPKRNSINISIYNIT